MQSKAKLPTIGKEVDNAMDAIEKDNPSLKDVLPKVYARGNLDPTSLGELIDLISNIALGDAKARSADVLGHVFEYFLGEFALAEGKKVGNSIHQEVWWSYLWKCLSHIREEFLIHVVVLAECSYNPKSLWKNIKVKSTIFLFMDKRVTRLLGDWLR